MSHRVRPCAHGSRHRDAGVQMRLGRRAVGMCVVAALAACGGGGHKASPPATTAKAVETTTTTPFVRPASCIGAMHQADEVFDAQEALDRNATDVDNALTDLANAEDHGGAAKRTAAQAKVDAATQKDAPLRSQLLTTTARYMSQGAQCKTELGTRSLTAACQGVLGEATLVIASIQKLLASDDQIIDLDHQIVTQIDKGKYDASNALVDQVNGLIDTVKAAWDTINPRIDSYDSRVEACTAAH